MYEVHSEKNKVCMAYHMVVLALFFTGNYNSNNNNTNGWHLFEHLLRPGIQHFKYISS